MKRSARQVRDKQKVMAIVGPTASGKTSLSVEIAKRFNSEIISADSRQIYRGLDIGTEKISQKEMAGIVHHLIDIRNPDESYSAGEFIKDAKRSIAEIMSRGRVPIIVGGTHFYIDALRGISPLADVPPKPTLREKLELLSTEDLLEKLQRTDPERAQTVDPSNRRRLIRALEIIESAGSVSLPRAKDPPFDTLLIGLMRDREAMRTGIASRIEESLKRGLIAETRALLDGGISPQRLSEIGVYYKTVIEFLNGAIEEAEMKKRLTEKCWQYAKRQLTWLKKMPDVEWFDPDDRKGIFERVQEFLKTK